MKTAYEEALADPNMREIEPGLVMRPFHRQYNGFDQDWHVYCERHPGFGCCAPERYAEGEALRHVQSKH